MSKKNSTKNDPAEEAEIQEVAIPNAGIDTPASEIDSETTGETMATIEEIISEPPEEPSTADDAAEGAAVVEAVEETALKITSVSQAKAIIEALLFAAGDPVSPRRLAKTMGGMNVEEVRGLVAQLGEEYDRDQRGLQIIEMAGGFQLSTRPEYAEWILQLTGQKRRSPLTGAALETLAIIAYKQPITRAEVDAIRGVESGGVVRTLLDLELIEVKGRKEVLGKPQLYGTSEKFLRAFGLRQLEDLPSIQELRERYQIGKQT